MLLYFSDLAQMPVGMTKDGDEGAMCIGHVPGQKIRAQIGLCGSDIIDRLIAHFEKPGYIILQVIKSYGNRERVGFGVVCGVVHLLLHNESKLDAVRNRLGNQRGLRFGTELAADPVAKQ